MDLYYWKKAIKENKKFFIQFGGQGNSFLKELQILYERSDLKAFFDVAFDAIEYCLNREDIKSEFDLFYPSGFPLKMWLTKEIVPDQKTLSICTVTFPANQITQLANLYVFIKNGYDPDDFLNFVHSTTGHSGGLQAAVIFSLGRKGKDLLEIIYKFIIWYTIAGYHAQKAYGFPHLEKKIIELSSEMDKDNPYPMAAVSNIDYNELLEKIELFHLKYPDVKQFPLKISLVNSSTNFVITGHAKDLVLFRREFYEEFLRNKVAWNYIPVSIPFHRYDTMKEKIYDFYNDPACKDLIISGKDLKIPVISFTDGENLQNIKNIPVYLADIMMNQVLYWDRAIHPLFDKNSNIGFIFDFGPGKITTILTKIHLKEKVPDKNIEMISAVGRAGLNLILKREN